MITELAIQPETRGFEINAAPSHVDLPQGFAEFYAPLHARFTPWQQELVAHRKQVLAAAHAGTLPDHLPPSPATHSPWRIEVPKWAEDQRSQMTGPVDDAALTVQVLNSGAPGV